MTKVTTAELSSTLPSRAMKFLRALPSLLLLLAMLGTPTAHADTAESLRQQAEAVVPAGLSVEQLGRLYTDKIGAARQLGDVSLQARLLREAVAVLPEPRWPNDLALIERDAGHLDEALRLYDLAIERSPQEHLRVFYMLNRLAVPAKRSAQKQRDEALALRERAQRALRPLGPGGARVNVLRALAGTHAIEGDALRRLGRSAESIESYRACEVLAREALAATATTAAVAQAHGWPTAQQLALAQRNLAGALIRAGLHAEAESALARLSTLVREHRLSPAFESSTLALTAGLRLRRGEYADAERQLRASQQVLERLNYSSAHPFQSQRRRDLIAALWGAGRHNDAARELELHDRALEAEPAARANARLPFERGLVLLSTRRAAHAAPEFAAVARINRSELGDSNYYTLQAEALEGTALWRSQDADLRERAAQQLEHAVPAMMNPRHADYHDDVYLRRQIRSLVFEAYLEAMAWRGGAKAAEAIGIADRLLAGATSQAMTDAAMRAAAAGQPDLADAVRREQDARELVRSLLDELRTPDAGDDETRPARDANEVDAVRRRLSEAEVTLASARSELSSRFPAFERLLRPTLASPDDVRSTLAANEALLLALPTEHALLSWLATPGREPRFVRVPVSRATLVEQVQRLRRGLDFADGPRPKFDAALAHELYRTVLGPFAQDLPDGTHLVIATTGPLAALPFAALPTKPPGEGQTAWSAQRWAMSQVPSIAAWLTLRQLRPSQSAAEALLAWADPAYVRPATPVGTSEVRGAASLPALHETRAEVVAIAEALKAQPERDLRLGQAATRDSVLAANRSGELARKRVVVFATHGLTAGDLPGLTQPALALAPPPGSSDPVAGLVGLDDILGLRLAADWVVLSACNTAASDGRNEQALSGLARGFLHAGGRSLLVTHWAVETESAKLLTIATFEHHAANERIGKAESLRQAMLKVMAMPRYAHPAYWAPFALVGDGAR